MFRKVRPSLTIGALRRFAARRLARALTYRERSLSVTRAGKLFLLLTLAVGFAAINTGSNLLHALFGAQMALILASGVLSDAVVNRTRLRFSLRTVVPAGEPTYLRVALVNRHPRSPILSVRVVPATDAPQAEAASTRGRPPAPAPITLGTTYAAFVPPHGAVERTITVTASHRGLWRLPPVAVVTGFPFGLFEKRRTEPSPGTILVGPRLQAPMHEAAGPGAADRNTSSPRTGPMRNGGFRNLRDYRAGDDPRKIAWRATARRGDLVVREEERCGAPVLDLVLEPGRTGDPAFEAAVERAAGLAVREADRRTRTRLVYGGREVVPPGTGPEHTERILAFLALCGDRPPGDAVVPADRIGVDLGRRDRGAMTMSVSPRVRKVG